MRRVDHRLQALLLFLVALLVDGTKMMHEQISHGDPFTKIIRVGHLQPPDPAIAHEPEVLKLCAKDLKERRILPNNITLQ